MIKRYCYFFCLAMTGLVLSCKKDDKVEIPKVFPVDLVAERWVERVETRLFSDNKEIKDAAVIQAFEEQVNLKAWIEGPFVLEEGDTGLKFESELTAALYSPVGQGPLYDVVRKGTRFLFYSQATYGINPSLPPSIESLGFLHAMLSYSDVLGSPSPDGTRQTREVWVAHGNYKVLKLSVFAYELRRHLGGGDGGGPHYAHGGVLFNEFNTDVSKFLGPADTLAVKEYSIICSLRK